MSDDNGDGMRAPDLINEPDFLAEGFEQLDSNLLDAKAPRVKLLPAFHDRPHERQVDYLLKLASTMNHAAKLISTERDKLVGLMVKKEAQLEKMSAQMRANNEMLQSEVARMNEQRQGYHAEVMRLGKEIKELESGDLD